MSRTDLAPAPDVNSSGAHSRWRQLAGSAPVQAGLIAALVFLLTLQTHVNGSQDPYVTDVGEIQNALPRWGTLHFSGYPLYSLTGSFIVTLLHALGIEPAAAASAVSLLWAALAVAVLARLALELGASRPAALFGALVFAVSTSTWAYASLAEVDTLTVLFIVTALLLAVRFGRDGDRLDLLALVLVFTQGVLHIRAVLFLAPALAVLVWPQWRAILKYWRPVVILGLLSPLVYLYMPLREWMGADWTFGQTSTWRGFWAMVLDTKADRIIHPPAGVGELITRTVGTVALLGRDLPLILLAVGLVAIIWLAVDPKAPGGIERRVAAGLTLAWVPFAALCLVIWEGRTSDALLAVKLPVAMIAGLGLALLVSWLALRWRRAGRVALVALVVSVVFCAWRNYPTVAAVTHDRAIEATIATAQQAANPGRPLTLMAPWGHSYWALAYAQKYRGDLAGVRLVDHNADFAAIVRGGSALAVLADTFYDLPLDWWTQRLGPVYPETLAPGLVELRTAPRLAAPAQTGDTINDDLAATHALVTTAPDGTLVVSVDWLAHRAPSRDYSVAVHLVPADAPDSAPLATADVANPVGGWYPTSHWQAGQLVHDAYRLDALAGEPGRLVRITAYYRDANGEFVNGQWLSLRAP